MRSGNGNEIIKDQPITNTNIAVLSEHEYLTAVYRWTRKQDYYAATTEEGHTWQGIYTPDTPPRELIIAL